MGLGRKRALRPPGRGARGWARLTGWILAVVLAAPMLRAQNPPSSSFDIAAVLGLIGEQRLAEAESFRRITAFFGGATADLDLALGAAFLEAKDFVKSLAYLESAWSLRRSLELAKAAAYAAFMAEDWDKAERFAMDLLDGFQDTETSCEILGSTALIQDDPARALLYWNRIGKPVLFDIVFDPPQAAAHLKRALPADKGKILRVRDWRALEDFLSRLDLIRNHRLLLMPRQDGLYDLQVRVEMKKPFFESPVDFLASEAFHLLQSQFHLEWNRIAGSRYSLGLLYRYQDYRRGLTLEGSHALAFGSNLDFHMAYASRDETWYPESSRSISFRQSLLQGDAAGRLFGGAVDRLGFFYKSYAELGRPERRYWGNAWQKRVRLAEAPRSALAAFLDAGAQWEVGPLGSGAAKAYGSLYLNLTARVGLPVGAWRSSLFYGRTWFPDLSDSWILGVGPGLRHLMRAHTYQLNRVGAEGDALLSKHFLLGNNQIELELTPRSLIDLRAVAFWDCWYGLDRGPGRSGGTVNDIGLGLEIGFLSKRIASLSVGYNLEKRSLAVYLGPAWSWN